MPSAEPQAPAGLIRARPSDFPRLVRLAGLATARGYRLAPENAAVPLLVMAVVLVGATVAVVVDRASLVPALAVTIWMAAGLLALQLLAIPLTVLLRLSDARRMILMSANRRAVIDFRMRRDGQVELSSHSVLVRDNGDGHRIRQLVAAHVIATGSSVIVRAQSPKVASVYQSEFPALVRADAQPAIGWIVLRTHDAAAEPEAPTP